MAAALISTSFPLSEPRYAGPLEHIIDRFDRPAIEAAIELLLTALDAMDAPAEDKEPDDEDGCYAEDYPIVGGDRLPGDADDAVAFVQRDLAAIGYACPQTGTLDPETSDVLCAFQRRYRPWRIDGRLDGETHARARALRELINR